MTVEEISDLYFRICTITTKYTFTHPVEDSDIATVRAELAAACPECKVSIGMGVRRDAVGIVITHDNKTVYQRLMLVKKEW